MYREMKDRHKTGIIRLIRQKEAKTAPFCPEVKYSGRLKSFNYACPRAPLQSTVSCEKRSENVMI